MVERGLRHVEIAVDIGLEGLGELLFGDIADVFGFFLMGGIVDENVELAELRRSLVHGLFAEALGADIAPDQQRFLPFALDQRLGFLGVRSSSR